MKKRKMFMVMIVVLAMAMTGCSEADRISSNLSKEADAFNIVRQLTVINCIQGDVLFQMTGRISIQPDMAENQLEIIVEYGPGQYKKDFIGLSDNVTYTVEQIDPIESDPYKYDMNYNPKMWLPIEFDIID
jgi:hypothetical protein